METAPLPAGGIVVAVDGSQCADRALAWAATEAALDHRPLILVHGTGSLGTTGTVWVTENDPVARRSRAHGEELLASAEQRARTAHPSLEVRTAVVADDPRDAVLRIAADAMMVVLGSRGRGRVRSLLLGSVSAAVARQASCPVVVVRPHHLGAVRRGVLLGVDGDVRSLPTVELAYREASIRGLPLTALHCVHDSRADLDEARLLLAESVSGMGEKYPDVHVTLTLEAGQGSPEQCLTSAADQMDLLVIGRHHASALSRAAFGDVAGFVVEHARTTVAIVPKRV